MSRELRALQARFFALATGRDPIDRVPLASWLGPEDESAAARRVEAYARSYEARLHDCLREDFPALARALGEEWSALAADYLARHPPSSFSLRHLGARLAVFAADHPLARRRPWIGDLAALEWARADVFDGPDTPRLGFPDLALIAEDAWPALRLVLAPRARVLVLRHAVQEAWRAVEDGCPISTVAATPTALLVWRRDQASCHRLLERREARALRRIEVGATFARVCECWADDDDPAFAAWEALRCWIGDGVLGPLAR